MPFASSLPFPSLDKAFLGDLMQFSILSLIFRQNDEVLRAKEPEQLGFRLRDLKRLL